VGTCYRTLNLSPWHCREFCDQHVAFVDDTLAGIELVRMQRHLAECKSCAKHDAKIRRALLLFRNLPSIEPSAGFSQRLEARLRECESDHLLAATQRNLRRGAIAATLASAAMLGYIATTLYHHSDAPRDLVWLPWSQLFRNQISPQLQPRHPQ